nr:major facilitator superfamily domain-containing protein 12-like [Leptinotarsa decemlineata]
MEPEEGNRLCLPLQKISFGLGHVFNDLCAAMWFSYTLFYLQVVLTMESRTAGLLLMIGQVVDSVSTPMAGWIVDHCGHRKLCHLGGTIAVSVGFCMIFSMKPTTYNTSALTYYALVISVFQIGWAIVQISHLSIIPEISRSHSHSSDLTAISQEIALLITFIGLLSSMLFYCGLLGTYENEYETIGETEIEDANTLHNHNGKHFLKSFVIYCVSVMYMTSRLFTTLNLIYIPLYINERGALNDVDKEKVRETIATVPLASYISSFLTAIFLKFRIEIFTDKVTYFIGSLIGLVASIWIGIGVSQDSDGQLFVIATLLGISGSSTMVSSLCITANFVKTNGCGGGLVYSLVTFTDKLISGCVVLLIQNLQCSPSSLCPHFYENVLSYICAVVTLVGLLSLILLQLQIRKNSQRI